ncbi:hypothetical protein CK222_30525 [Mesorhizobium sp. WSM3866]|nr:hypothetical protein CK222_30525 [Mesorhizobium sp. WSM3866]
MPAADGIQLRALLHRQQPRKHPHARTNRNVPANHDGSHRFRPCQRRRGRRFRRRQWGFRRRQWGFRRRQWGLRRRQWWFRRR